MSDKDAANVGSTEKSNTGEVRARLLQRSLRVIQLLADMKGRAKLQEICNKSGLSRATALRILRTFMDFEFVEYDSVTRFYSIGPGFFQLSSNALESNTLVRNGQKLLNALRDETGETACLFQQRGNDRYCIASANSHHELGMNIEPGQRRPIFAGSPGRILVMGLTEEFRDRIINSGTELERSKYDEECASLSSNGVVVSHDEIIQGATAIAVPVTNAVGSIDTSLAIIGPSVRLKLELVKKFQKFVRDAGAELSGHRRTTNN